MTKKNKNREIIRDICFQGELCFQRVPAIPASAKTRPVKPEGGVLIVGHSETGHHHVVEAADAKLLETESPLVAYLVAEGAYADVVHQRDFDTHPVRTLEGDGAIWKIIRQREMSPEGWRQVAD